MGRSPTAAAAGTPASLAGTALGLALTGDPLPADRAAEWGMILKAVDDDQLDAEVDAVAAKLASLPPLGLAAIKRIIRGQPGRTLDEELDLQRDEMSRLGFTHHDREGVAAFQASGEIRRSLADQFAEFGQTDIAAGDHTNDRPLTGLRR